MATRRGSPEGSGPPGLPPEAASPSSSGRDRAALSHRAQGRAEQKGARVAVSRPLVGFPTGEGSQRRRGMVGLIPGAPSPYHCCRAAAGGSGSRCWSFRCWLPEVKEDTGGRRKKKKNMI